MCMKKCLLWGTGVCFEQNVNLVKFHEITGHFEVVGVTSNTAIYNEIRGYQYIYKSDLKNVNFDIVVIMAYETLFKEIYSEVQSLGIPQERIFKYDILCHPDLNIEKYIMLKKNPPSIFSNNCWGGVTYHSIGLEFTSPFINMYESETDYLKLLKNPKRYMRENLEFVNMCYNAELKIDFPVAKCGDILLYFNHYDSFESAKNCWERRKKRIDWDNLFIMMYTENRNLAQEFAKLSYKKKVCFVPFESDEESLLYVEFRNKKGMAELPFWKIVIGMAKGNYPYYDIFDLLEEAKFTKVADFKGNWDEDKK